MIEAIARVLRRKSAIQLLLPDLSKEIAAVVPVDWLRVDLTDDQGRLWSRTVKPGQEAQRTELGGAPRIGSREAEYAKPIEGGFEACLLLGIGSVAGRLIVRRKSGPFDADLERLRSIADVLSLALRARPFDPPVRPRSPFEDEESPMV